MELEDESHLPVAHPGECILAHPVKGLAVEHDVPAIGAVECAEDVEERALPRTARSHHRHHLAAPHGEIHPVEHVDGTSIPADVALTDLVRLDDHHSCRIASTG